MIKEHSQLENIRVLIAEDDKMMQTLIQEVLKQLGFTSLTATASGRAAIELLERFDFDLVISDWRMKDMDGIDIIRFVRRDPKARYFRIPIILLTGNTEAHYVLQARDAGVNEYIIKPFTAEQLARRIRNLIEKPRGFVAAPIYSGPDRRHRRAAPPVGQERRKTGKSKKTKGK